MNFLVAFPSTAVFGQQAALAFAEVGALEAMMTTFAYRPTGLVGSILSNAPPLKRLHKELTRRGLTALAPAQVETRPVLEIVRTVADKIGAGPVIVDQIWDYLSKDFTRAAGRRLADATRRTGSCAIYGYEYSALEAFRIADRLGTPKVLDFPSLNSREFEALQQEQKRTFPELVTPHDAYFERLFSIRQARRDAEMASADIIITNSSVTRASHIKAGADPQRVFSVPYGSPVPTSRVSQRRTSGPLRVVWAGTFSLRKGAHLFASAWREFARSGEGIADVFGAMAIPERLWSPAPPNMQFHGSVLRQRLFEAFDLADVLMFPTLSDGFGMVVTEAFARGLPVVTTDRAGASDLVRHLQNGLIIPAGDQGAILAALEWCANNRDALSAMRPVAHATAIGWQWSDYRRALRTAVAEGLERAGRLPPNFSSITSRSESTG